MGAQAVVRGARPPLATPRSDGTACWNPSANDSRSNAARNSFIWHQPRKTAMRQISANEN